MGMIVGSAFGMDKYEKYKEDEKEIAKLDKEHIPFTAPRYQATWGDYKKQNRNV